MSSPSVSLQSSPKGLQKAAVVLLSLGPAASAEIFKQLREEEVDLLSADIARMDAVSPANAETILTEFQSAVSTRTAILKGGLDPVRSILTEAFGRRSRAPRERNHLDVQLDPRGVVIRLPQALLFPPGDDRVNADALATVAAIGNVLSKIPNDVILIGHADAVPIHNRRFGSNWELAAVRGLRLLENLSKSYGIEESRLSVESFGSYDPKGTNDTPEGRASNRRVEIVVREDSSHSKL